MKVRNNNSLNECEIIKKKIKRKKTKTIRITSKKKRNKLKNRKQANSINNLLRNNSDSKLSTLQNDEPSKPNLCDSVIIIDDSLTTDSNVHDKAVGDNNNDVIIINDDVCDENLDDSDVIFVGEGVLTPKRVNTEEKCNVSNNSQPNNYLLQNYENRNVNNIAIPTSERTVYAKPLLENNADYIPLCINRRLVSSSNIRPVAPVNIHPGGATNIHPVAPANIQPVGATNIHSVVASNAAVSNLNHAAASNIYPAAASNICHTAASNINPSAVLSNYTAPIFHPSATSTITSNSTVYPKNINNQNQVNKYGNNMYNAGTVTRKGLRMIVIDGSNVAMGHSNGKYFSVKGLDICIKFFLKRGHKVIAFVPQFRTKYKESSDPNLLRYLQKLGHVILTPSRDLDDKRICSYDDRYIIQCAAENDGIIVSSDNFRDLIKENVIWKETIEQRLLMPTWVNDIIMFPTDPLGKTGPNLDDFLRFP